MASLGKHSLFINFVFIVLYHCTCVCGQERSTTVLKGGHISFAPLPEGEPYRSTVSDDNWILSSYEEIAKAVILALKDELPYGKYDNLFSLCSTCMVVSASYAN